MAAVIVLLRAFFTAAPGIVWFNLIGVLALAGALLNSDADAQRAFLGATAFFLIAFPALFAGNRFRWLASQRSLLLLPGFVARLVTATLVLFAYLAMVASVLAALADLSAPTAAAGYAFAAVSAVFFFGFLPALPRFLLGSVLVGGLVASSGAPLPGATPVAVATVAGWLVFVIWFSRRTTRRMPFTVASKEWNMPLAIHAPWAQGIGTPAGTMLLGSGDAWSARLARAAFGVLFIPTVLIGAFVLVGGLTPERVLGAPVLFFLGLAYALGFQAHLAGRIADRRPSVWLYVDGGRAVVRRLVTRVAGAELTALALMLMVLVGMTGLVRGQQPETQVLVFAAFWLVGAAVITGIPFLPRVGATCRGWLSAAVFLLLAVAAAIPQVVAKTL